MILILLLILAAVLFLVSCFPNVPDKPFVGAAGIILCAAVYALKLGL